MIVISTPKVHLAVPRTNAGLETQEVAVVTSNNVLPSDTLTYRSQGHMVTSSRGHMGTWSRGHMVIWSQGHII